MSVPSPTASTEMCCSKMEFTTVAVASEIALPCVLEEFIILLSLGPDESPLLSYLSFSLTSASLIRAPRGTGSPMNGWRGCFLGL